MSIKEWSNKKMEFKVNVYYLQNDDIYLDMTLNVRGEASFLSAIVLESEKLGLTNRQSQKLYKKLKVFFNKSSQSLNDVVKKLEEV